MAFSVAELAFQRLQQCLQRVGRDGAELWLAARREPERTQPHHRTHEAMFTVTARVHQAIARGPLVPVQNNGAQ
jgi:hypothetical protein